MKIAKKLLLAPVALVLFALGFVGATLIPPMAAFAGADPAPTLAVDGNAFLDVLTKDGPWWLGVVVLHVALRVFLDRQHWINQGKLLSGLTALGGLLTAVIAWHFQGASSAGILTALVAGGTLLVHPVAQPAKGGAS